LEFKTNKLSCGNCADKSCAVSTLNAEQLRYLDDNSIETNIKKGEIIMHAGSFNSSIIYLKTGYVKEYVAKNESKSEIIQIIKHHSYLGLQSLFGDKFNHYTYAALEDLKICQINPAILKQLIKENGNFALEILQCVCRENLYITHRIINQNFKRADGKFADVLLYLANDIFESPSFDLPLSRQDLADLIGLSRENTIRVLSKFKSEGIINIDGKKIEILNLDLIHKISKNG
jgi:CRP-like cAMP-binding protein